MALKRAQKRKKKRRVKGRETNRRFDPNRVLKLYRQPGFETWEKVGQRLRLSRGSAWSLAHGLRAPDPRTLDLLELIEWKEKYFWSAAANLAGLAGLEKLLPKSVREAIYVESTTIN